MLTKAIERNSRNMAGIALNESDTGRDAKSHPLLEPSMQICETFVQLC